MTEEERKIVRDFLKMDNYDEILNIEPKGYFSKDYKNKHKHTNDNIFVFSKKSFFLNSTSSSLILSFIILILFILHFPLSNYSFKHIKYRTNASCQVGNLSKPFLSSSV